MSICVRNSHILYKLQLFRPMTFIIFRFAPSFLLRPISNSQSQIAPHSSSSSSASSNNVVCLHRRVHLFFNESDDIIPHVFHPSDTPLLPPRIACIQICNLTLTRVCSKESITRTLIKWTALTLWRPTKRFMVSVLKCVDCAGVGGIHTRLTRLNGLVYLCICCH